MAFLPYLGILSVKGLEAEKFLQGQLTCDLHSISDAQGSLGACCDPKGRMLTSFFIWGSNATYYLLLPPTMLSPTLSHLKKYVLRTKVDLRIEDDLTAVAFNGKLSELNPEIIRIPFFADTYLLIGNLLTINNLFQELSPTVIFNKNKWQAFNIQAGIVWIHPETQGLFIPQMINLQKLGGVSFKKGCYVGQEIIARTENLGKLKRHLYHAILESSVQIKLGDELTNKAGTVIGIVVALSKISSTKYELLAVLQEQLLSDNVDVYFQSVALRDVSLK